MYGLMRESKNLANLYSGELIIDTTGLIELKSFNKGIEIKFFIVMVSLWFKSSYCTTVETELKIFFTLAVLNVYKIYLKL